MRKGSYTDVKKIITIDTESRSRTQTYCLDFIIPHRIARQKKKYLDSLGLIIKIESDSGLLAIKPENTKTGSQVLNEVISNNSFKFYFLKIISDVSKESNQIIPNRIIFTKRQKIKEIRPDLKISIKPDYSIFANNWFGKKIQTAIFFIRKKLIQVDPYIIEIQIN